MNQVFKWVFLLSVASLVFNGLRYWGTGDQEVLINTYSAAGLGVLSVLGLVFARKKR
ncbi:UNVERIFIED_CONTAM: LPXTG-motif cell wall-anchored protein [Brevibacillus sp. OAP136]|uniref:hypothetical protein n=1 Tax=Brevibacillus fluminis TaxID=511487 RepID=UPI0016057FDE|nr:hypothetical protein [Brevibacillus fluminis]